MLNDYFLIDYILFKTTQQLEIPNMNMTLNEIIISIINITPII